MNLPSLGLGVRGNTKNIFRRFPSVRVSRFSSVGRHIVRIQSPTFFCSWPPNESVNLNRQFSLAEEVDLEEGGGEEREMSTDLIRRYGVTSRTASGVSDMKSWSCLLMSSCWSNRNRSILGCNSLRWL